MAVVDDYNDSHHVRRDIRDAFNNANVAKILSYLAIIGAAIALAVALNALNKATDALNNANRAVESTQQTR